MSLVTLCAETVTVAERLAAEDASGNATYRTTIHAACFTQVTEAMRWAAGGTLPADAVFVTLLPDGYGETWSLKPGDTVTRSGVSYTVHSQTAVYAPRSQGQRLSHIEAMCS